jgi:hypothetical protein
MPNNFAISQVDNFLCDIGGMISDPLDMTRNSEIPWPPFFKGGNPFTGSSNKSAGNWCHWPTKPFDLTDQPMQAPQLSYLTENSIPINDKQ